MPPVWLDSWTLALPLPKSAFSSATVLPAYVMCANPLQPTATLRKSRSERSEAPQTIPLVQISPLWITLDSTLTVLNVGCGDNAFRLWVM